MSNKDEQTARLAKLIRQFPDCKKHKRQLGRQEIGRVCPDCEAEKREVI